MEPDSLDHETDQTAAESAPATEAAVQQAESAAAPVATPEAPKPAPARRQPAPPGRAVSGGDKDEVRLSACVFKNKFARKSLSVYHVQRRLNELGYRDAYTDKTGWYGDLTLKSVREYQAANGLAGEGVIDRATLDHLFSDDTNVTVVD